MVYKFVTRLYRSLVWSPFLQLTFISTFFYIFIKKSWQLFPCLLRWTIFKKWMEHSRIKCLLYYFLKQLFVMTNTSVINIEMPVKRMYRPFSMCKLKKRKMVFVQIVNYNIACYFCRTLLCSRTICFAKLKKKKWMTFVIVFNNCVCWN